MMKAPLVSIGVPVYNGEQYIRQALDGLIAQTYQNFEIIISDNASTDNTKNICLEYINRDNRISYYGNEINIGATENFNRLVKLAKGKYFMWAAADDIFLPKFIEKCVEKMEEEPSLILCYSSLRFIDEKGQVIKNVNYDLYDNPNLSDHDMEARLKKWWGMSGWYAVYGLYRLDILCSSNLFTNVYGGDVLFITELLYKGPFGKIPQVLFLYRQFQKKTEIDRYNSQSEENKSKSLSLDYCHVNLYINIYDNILAHDFTLSKKIILILNLVRAWKRHVYNKLNGFVIFSIKNREFPNILKVSWFYILEIIKTPYNLTLKVINKITYFFKILLELVELPFKLINLSVNNYSLSLSKMKNSNIKKCALIEYNWWHDETIPSLVFIMNSLDFQVDVFTSNRNMKKDVFYHLDGLNFSLHCSDGIAFQIFEKLHHYNNYDIIIINTLEEPSNIIERVSQLSIPLIAVIHNAYLVKLDNKYKKFFSQKNRGILVIAKHIANYLHDQSYNITWFMPVLLGDIQSNNELLRITFCVQGNVDFSRRNYLSLLSSTKKLVSKGIKNFLILIVGRNDNNDGIDLKTMISEQGLNEYFRFSQGELDYRDYYYLISSAQFILPLIDNTDLRYNPYFEDKATSSVNISLGLGVIPIIHKNLAELYDIVEGCILYEDNELDKAMEIALQMDNMSIKRKQQYLNDTQRTMLKNSIDRVKELINTLIV